jgi:class 3 adenylate cyclase
MRPWDLKLLDVQFKVLRALGPTSITRDVTIVGIDEATIAAYPEPLTLWHKQLGHFLQVMTVAKPSVVGMDLILPDRSYDSVTPGYDNALVRGLLAARQAFPLVMARTIDPTGKPRAIYRPFVAAAGDDAEGFALFPFDADGTVRRFDECLGANGESVATLAGQMARRIDVPVTSGYIDFSLGERFGYIPLKKVLAWADAGEHGRLESIFRGRPVLVGIVLPYTDRLRLPVSLESSASDTDSAGVFLHAQVLRNLLGGNLIQPVHPALVSTFALVLTLLWFVPGGPLRSILVLSGAILGLMAASLFALGRGWYLPIVLPVIAAVAGHGGRQIYETALKLVERRRLRGVFSGYVSPPVMREILDGHVQPQLGGSSHYVCVLFSDIRGYTTRSEDMTPADTVSFLNRYFEDAVALIHAEGGTVVCFMGDGIMAVFGAPNVLDNPCVAAFRAGRNMLMQVTRFNADSAARGEAPIDIGVGLQAGDAVVGHVGSSERHDYTAIGDVTNVASRLEGLTKEAGYRMVCSAEVVARLPERDDLVSLGPMAIKGHKPLEVYGYDKV